MEQSLFETKQEEKKGNFSRLVISPLQQGYGHTLGNSLRRVLLTSLAGAAITQVKISGVRHQFSSLKGMKEDVLDFLLNLKKVRLSYRGEKPIKLELSAKGPGEIKASEIKTPAGVEVVNPDLVLATLAKGAKMEVKMEAESGVGYSPAEERKTGKVGLIPLDAIFSPILRADYRVEETRVGRRTNYDKLVLEITTDGTIEPKQALVQAAEVLVACFNQIISPKKIVKKEAKKEEIGLGPVGNLSVEEIGLPTRVANALIRAGYDTVKKLAEAKDEDLAKVRNLGEKSIKIAKIALAERGVGTNA